MKARQFNRSTEARNNEEAMKILNAEFQNITEIKRVFRMEKTPLSIVYNNGQRVASIESMGNGYIIHYLQY